MSIYLIRHTKPKIDPSLCYGQSDVPLADDYVVDFEKLKTKLPKSFNAVYTSPLSRCRVLAESLAAPQTIFPDERLLELDFGDWENQPWEWIYQNGGDAWMNAFVDQRTPGGESFIDLAERAKIFWNEKVLEKGIAGQSLAVVTHAGVIRAFLCHLLEIPLRNAFKIKLDYGSVTQVDLSATGLPNIRFVNLT